MKFELKWYLFFPTLIIMFISLAIKGMQNNFISNLSVLVSFFGGMYCMYLIYKTEKRRNK